MSTKRNHRRDEPAEQDSSGPRSYGTAPRVARARRGWKRGAVRTERRTGQRSKALAVHLRGKPRPRPDGDL